MKYSDMAFNSKVLLLVSMAVHFSIGREDISILAVKPNVLNMERPYFWFVVIILIIMALTNCDAAYSSRQLTSQDFKRVMSDLKSMSGAPPFKHFVSGSVNETQSRRILTLVYDSGPKKQCHLKVNEFLDPDTKDVLKSESKVQCRTQVVQEPSEAQLEMKPFDVQYVLKMLRVRLKKNRRIKNVLHAKKTVFPTKSVIVVTYVTVASETCTVTVTRLKTGDETSRTTCRWSESEDSSEHRMYIYKLIQRLKRKLTRALEITTNSYIVSTFQRLNLIIQKLEFAVKSHQNITKHFSQAIRKIFLEIQKLPRVDKSILQLIKLILKVLDNPEEVEDREKINQELVELRLVLTEWVTKSQTTIKPDVRKLLMALDQLNEFYKEHGTYPINFSVFVKFLLSVLREISDVSGSIQSLVEEIRKLSEKVTHHTSPKSETERFKIGIEKLKEETQKELSTGGDQKNHDRIIKLLDAVLNEYVEYGRILPATKLDLELISDTSYTRTVEKLKELLRRHSPSGVQIGLQLTKIQEYLIILENWWKKGGTETGLSREKVKEILPLLRELIESYNKLKTFPLEEIKRFMELLKELENLKDTKLYTLHIIQQIMNTLTHSSDNHEDSPMELPELLEALEEWVDSLGNGSRHEIKEIVEILHKLNTYTKHYKTFPKNTIPAIKYILSKLKGNPKKIDILTAVLIEKVHKALPNEVLLYLVLLHDWWLKKGTEKGQSRKKIKEIQPLLHELIENYSKLKTFQQEELNTLMELLKELENLKDTNPYTRQIINQIEKILKHSSDNLEDSHIELPELLEALEEWVNSLGHSSKPEIEEILEILHPLNSYTKRYKTFPKNYIPAIKKILSKVENISEKMDVNTPVLIDQIQEALPNEVLQHLVSLHDWWKKTGTEKGESREIIKEIQPLLHGLIKSYNKFKTFPPKEVNTFVERLEELENIKNTNQYTRHIIKEIIKTLTHSSDNHEDSHIELPDGLEALEEWVDSLGNRSRPEIKEILEILHPLNTYTKHYKTFPKNYIPAVQKILSKIESIPEKMDINTPVLIDQIQEALPNEVLQHLVSLHDWWKKTGTEKGESREIIKEIQPLLHGLIKSYNKFKTFPPKEVNTFVERLEELENIKDTNQYTRHIIKEIIKTLTHSSDNREDSHIELPERLEALEEWVDSLGNGSRPEVKEILEILHPLNTYTKHYKTFPKNYIPAIQKILSKIESIPEKMDINTPVLIDQIQEALPNEVLQHLGSLHDWWKKTGTEKGESREIIKEIQPVLHGLIKSYNKFKTFPPKEVNTFVERLEELENIKDTNQYTRHIIKEIIKTLTHSSDNREDSHIELPERLEALEEWVDSLGNGSRPEVKEILEILHPLNTYTKHYKTFPKNYIPAIQKILSKIESIPEKMDINTPVLIDQIQEALPNEVLQHLVSLHDWWKKTGTEKGESREIIKEIQPLLHGLIKSYNKFKTFPPKEVNTFVERLEKLENVKNTNQYTRHIIKEIIKTLTRSSDNREDSHIELPERLEALEEWVDSLGNGSRPEVKEILEILHPLNTYTKHYKTFPKNYIPAIQKILSKIESIPEKMDINTPVLIDQIQEALPNEVLQHLVSLHDWWKKTGTEKGESREIIKEIQPLLHGLIKSYNKFKTFPPKEVNTFVERLEKLENVKNTNQYTRHIIKEIIKTLTRSSDNREDSHIELPERLEALEEWVDSLGNGSRPEVKEILEILHPLNTYTKHYKTFPKNYIPAIQKILSKIESIPEKMDINTPVLIDQIQEALPNEVLQHLVSLHDWWKKTGTEKGESREIIKEIQPLLHGLIKSYNKFKTFPPKEVNTFVERLVELENIKDTNPYTRQIIKQLIKTLTHSSDNREDSHIELPERLEALEEWVDSLGNGSRPEIKEILEILHPLNTYTKHYKTFPKNYIPAIKKILSKVENIPEKMDINTPVLIEQIHEGVENITVKIIAQLSHIENEFDEWVAKHGKDAAPYVHELQQLQPDFHRLIMNYQKNGELSVKNKNELQVVFAKLHEIPDFGVVVDDYREEIEHLDSGLLSPPVHNTYIESTQALIIVDDWLMEWSKTNVDKVQGLAQLHRILHPLVVHYKQHQTLPDNYTQTIETFLQKLRTTPEINKSTRQLITKIINVEEPAVESIQKCTPHDNYMAVLEKRLIHLEKEEDSDCQKYEKLLLIVKPMIDQYKKLGTKCE